MTPIAQAIHDAVIVVAHPDDEVLWFNSAIAQTRKVIVVFEGLAQRPLLGANRAKAIRDLPYQTENLRLAEAGTFDGIDWTAPRPASWGLHLNAPTADPAIAETYAQNAQIIMDRLAPGLVGTKAVFTHNPWGEYGHADHVQLYCVLNALRQRLGFSLWVSGTISDRSSGLARRYAAPPTSAMLHGTPDPALGAQAMQVYQRHDCWTWQDDWIWPKHEVFLPAPLKRADKTTDTTAADMPQLSRVPAP